MIRAYLPFRFQPSPALVAMLGDDLNAVAVLAVKAVIKHRKSLEIAHQQIVFRDQHVALSTRVSEGGDLIVDLDVGLPGLAGYVILEEDLRRATEAARAVAGLSQRQRRS